VVISDETLPSLDLALDNTRTLNAHDKDHGERHADPKGDEDDPDVGEVHQDPSDDRKAPPPDRSPKPVVKGCGMSKQTQSKTQSSKEALLKQGINRHTDNKTF
jgi:hypothetical protein